MRKFDSVNSVPVYEKPEEKLIVKNHWIYSGLVEIEIDGKTAIVDGQALIQAIKNAQNTGK